MSFLRKLVTGLTIPQQYICVALEELRQPLNVLLTLSKKNYSVEVTANHVFLGYKPLVIAITFPLRGEVLTSLGKEESICLSFLTGKMKPDFVWNNFNADKRCIARLILRKIKEQIVDDQYIIFYEGVHGEHAFLHPFHQFVNRKRERLRKNIPGNVALTDNLLDQVSIAYAVPRTIPLITIKNGSNLNMFPTDLHGAVGKKFYLSSLRIGGKANAQVEEFRKLVVSYIDANDFKYVYSLGRNHMQEMKDASFFKCAQQVSIVNKTPLPSSVIYYRELQQIESFDVGIHRIHLYEVLHEQKAGYEQTLAHIHQYYAQWRVDHGVETKMLMR